MTDLENMRAYLERARTSFDGGNFEKAAAAAALASAFAAAARLGKATATPGDGHPDLLDSDGDVWRWSARFDAYTAREGSVGWERADIERRYGPVTEVTR